jgi:hypothetical protein
MSIPTPAMIHHTCFLVRDLEGTAQRLADALAIGPWNVWTIQPAQCTSYGQPGLFSFRVALATIGGGTLELITPHSGRSALDDHLDKHGEGFHHMCLVYPSLETIHKAKLELRRQGRDFIMEASAGDVFDLTYVHFPEIGSLVELLYLDSSKLPAPEVIIQQSVAVAPSTV